MNISTIGLDLAKDVFQVHGVDSAGQVVVTKKLRRGNVLAFFTRLPGCLVGIEACASAHYWARELRALGHDVRLIPPAYVKAYVRRGKSDAIDAAAICEAVQRPSMRFVPIKTSEQQGALSPHRVRSQLVNDHTRYVNVLRAQMAEFGIIAARGVSQIESLLDIVADDNDTRLPRLARLALREVADMIGHLKNKLATINQAIVAEHKADPDSKRLATQPGVGPVIASAFKASVPDPGHFRTGRHFAASIGLTPRQNATGGKERLGRISKMGDRYLRMLLVLGATSVVAQAQRFKRPEHAWILRLLQRRPTRVVITAVANKMARVMWALMISGQDYRTTVTA
jgi:transposase